MASTYSTNLKIQLMGTGENTGTWGNVTNVNLGTALEEAIVGNVDVTFSSVDVTLTLTNTNATQTARNLRLNLIGTSGGARQLVVPSVEKVYIVRNGLADTVTVRTSGGAGVAIPTLKTMWVYSDGIDVLDVTTHLTSLTLGSPLPVASGGTGTNTGVNLQSALVSGVLPVANGGTGSATAAFNGSGITNLNASAIASGTIANAYTTANTANQSNSIVARDASGNFAANTITANLTGNVTGNVTGTASGNLSTSSFTGANQNTGSPGYQKLPGGIIMQWGYQQTNASSGNVTFPIAFPNACRSVQATFSSSDVSLYCPVVQNITTTGFTQGAYKTTASPAIYFYWYAIGY